MKELYYGRIPLGVPIQKRPPDKYASHPYPVLVEKQDCVYVDIAVLDSVFEEVVKERFFGDDTDQFIPSLIPTDSVFRNVIRTHKIDDTKDGVKLDTITCYMKPLDSIRKSIVITSKQDFKEVITNEIKPLESTFKRVVINHKVSGLDDVITQTMRPLDMIRQEIV